MACGVPVVAAAATGSTSLVVDGVSGRLVPPGDAPAFVNVLKDFIEQADMRLTQGRAGELRSREFDWDRINGCLAETYLKLVHSGRGRN
jgi:glycosyltransferase involved in cell wall biosynthesis